MATVSETLSSLDEGIQNGQVPHIKAASSPRTSPHSNGHFPQSKNEKSNSSRFRHIAAMHSKTRTSCLSHDSAGAPSFLGFRNLMVLVLSMYSIRISDTVY